MRTSKSFMVLQSVISEVLPAVVRKIDALRDLSCRPSEQMPTDNRARLLLRCGNATVEIQCRSRYSIALFLYGHLHASISSYARRAVQSINRNQQTSDLLFGRSTPLSLSLRTQANNVTGRREF